MTILDQIKKSAEVRRDAVVKDCIITFKTGYTCPDVSLSEVAATIARQGFDSRNTEIELLAKALECAMKKLAVIESSSYYSDEIENIRPIAIGAQSEITELLKPLLGQDDSERADHE